MQLLIPHWPGLPPHIGACMTQRQGGVSPAPFDDGTGAGGMNVGAHVGDDPLAVAANRLQLRRILPSSPAWLRQVHGVQVINAGTLAGAGAGLAGAVVPARWHPINEPEADASFSTVRAVVCAIQTADCLPVLFCDASGRVVGAAHAGWRGLAAGVLQQTVLAMRQAGAGEISAWLGPAIGPRHFEVGPDVCAAFAPLLAQNQAFIRSDSAAVPAFVPHPQHAGKFLADIYLLARLALAQVQVSNVAGGEFCTVSAPEQFYSYRRDQRTGRMVACIWLK